MRRILLIVAMLLLPVTSAMAVQVAITADVNAATHLHDGVKHKTVTIGYTATVDVRAFALDINVDNGCNIGDSNLTGYKTGESIEPAQGGTKGYGIFPGRFRDSINPTTPNWSEPNYSPLTPLNSPGALNTGLGLPKIVVELGTLYKGDPNKPALSGNLFTFDVNSEGKSDCNMTVAVNALRGGIVDNNGVAITDTNLPFTKKVTFDCFYEGKVDGKGHVVTAAEVAMWNSPLVNKVACWCYQCHPRGDVDNGCTITSVDVLAARNAWPNSPIFGAYNPCSDIDYSGTITSVDILAVRNAWPNSPIFGPGCTGLVGGCP